MSHYKIYDGSVKIYPVGILDRENRFDILRFNQAESDKCGTIQNCYQAKGTISIQYAVPYKYFISLSNSSSNDRKQLFSYSAKESFLNPVDEAYGLQIITNKAILEGNIEQQKNNSILIGFSWIATGALPLGFGIALIDRFVWKK